jgi:hypothetical protein
LIVAKKVSFRSSNRLLAFIPALTGLFNRSRMAYNSGFANKRRNHPSRDWYDARNLKRRFEDIEAASKGEDKLATTHSESQADPAVLTVDPGAPQLAMLDPEQVSFEFQRHGASYLEAKGEQINFYTPDPSRPEAANAYLMKVDAHENSTKALDNTVLHLLKAHHSDFATIRIEFPPASLSNDHLAHARDLTASADGSTNPGIRVEAARPSPATTKQLD